MKKDSDIETSRAKVMRYGRTIYFFDTVDETSVMEAIKYLTQLQTESLKKPVTMIINSPGGSCYDGLALYDCMRTCVVPITTVGMGLVASMAFIIFLAGDRRLTALNTRFLNHQVSSSIAGKATDIEIERAEIAELEELVVKIVSERTGMPASKIKKAVKLGDNYYSAEDALEKGIVHEIIKYANKTVAKEQPPVEPKA